MVLSSTILFCFFKYCIDTAAKRGGNISKLCIHVFMWPMAWNDMQIMSVQAWKAECVNSLSFLQIEM
jgi:hypothetical protein